VELAGLLACTGEMKVNTVYWSRYRVVVDPAVGPGALPERPRRVLVTHGHADHFRYAAAYREAGAAVLAPRLCAPMVEEPRLNQMATTGWAGPVEDWEITRYFLGPGVRVDYTLEEGMALPGVSALHTPGHTPGSMSYVFETGAGRVLVAGDTVYGREFLEETPLLYHTDTVAWIASLERLRGLGVDALVPGHGGPVEGRAEARGLVEANLAAVRGMLRLALSVLDPDAWVTGDEAAARVAEATGYARSRRAYSIVGPATRALLHALASMGEAEEDVRRGVMVWRRR